MMKRAKVFITQEIFSRGEDGEFRVKFDLTTAAERGNLVFLFGHGPVALQPSAMIEGIVQRLIDEEFDPELDYLLNIGDNTIAYALGNVIAKAFRKESVRVLRWDRRRRMYDEIPIFCTDALADRLREAYEGGYIPTTTEIT